jgi:uncharacterized protein (DUF58 family)
MSNPLLIDAASVNRHWLLRMHDGLNHDFCPWANRWVYWLKNPFWILLAGTLTAILCGIFVSRSVLALGAGLAVLLIMGVIWPWLCLRGVRGSIRFVRSRGRAGQPVLVEIELTNRWPWPVWGLEISQGFSVESSDFHGGLALAFLRGWTTRCVTWTFLPPRRGVYPLSTPQLETGFPFGLYRARRPLPSQNELIVWPRSTALDVMPDVAEIDARDDRASDRRAGDVGDMLGTRNFRQGDSLRRIHWAQSARQGRLIVCERQTPVSCAVRLLLDVHPQHHPQPGGAESLDRLLSVAASIVESLHREHAEIECHVGRDVYRVGSSLMELNRCLDALARIPANGLAFESPDVWCAAAKRRQRRFEEYVLTTSAGYPRLWPHWRASDRAHFVVAPCHVATDRNHTDSTGNRIPRRPWLELPQATDLLQELPRFWRSACHAR